LKRTIPYESNKVIGIVRFNLWNGLKMTSKWAEEVNKSLTKLTCCTTLFTTVIDYVE